MLFTIEGRVKNKKAVDIYVQELLKILNIHRRRSSELSIKFVTKLDGDVLGLASGGPRWGEVEIARTSSGEKLQFFEQMITLSHEMIHIKQFMKNELSPNTEFKSDEIPYKNQPWEQEAAKFEYLYFAQAFPWYMKIN
jgi:hypothetical protein